MDDTTFKVMNFRTELKQLIDKYKTLEINNSNYFFLEDFLAKCLDVCADYLEFKRMTQDGMEKLKNMSQAEMKAVYDGVISNPVLQTMENTISREIKVNGSTGPFVYVEDEGHRYLMPNMLPVPDGQMKQVLQFFKRTETTITPGVTNEQVLEVLLDRMRYLQKTLPCRENAIVITKLEESLMWLNQRTKLREQQKVEATNKPHISNCVMN